MHKNPIPNTMSQSPSCARTRRTPNQPPTIEKHTYPIELLIHRRSIDSIGVLSKDFLQIVVCLEIDSVGVQRELVSDLQLIIRVGDRGVGCAAGEED